jgi:UDP-N-acetylmuramoylalanine--D-glutamate ligase
LNNILVIGAGKSGVAAANFLARRGLEVILIDDKADAESHLPQPLDGGVRRRFGTYGHDVLDGVDTVILSPGVPPSLAIVQEAQIRPIPVISEIELAYRYLNGTIIAITGSNGKSTTTALIGEILRVAGRQPIVAGNIGEPLISALDLHRPRTYVVELSSFQLEAISEFHANIALLLNVTPDHMDRYATFDDYAAAKYRVFRNQKPADVAILNASERRSVSRSSVGRVWRFSSQEPVDQGAFLEGDQLVMRLDGQQRRIPRASLRIEGTANVENALAAWLAARAAGVDDVAVQIAFGSFNGLAHRMVLVRELDGVRYVNDSKGTNVDATLKSLEGLEDGRVILILGGKDKAGEFERMRRLVHQKVRAVLTVGAAAERIGSALTGSAEIVQAHDMAQAIAWAHGNARSGETVLLSPACASFDQYRNFEHRGDHFEELVRSL